MEQDFFQRTRKTSLHLAVCLTLFWLAQDAVERKVGDWLDLSWTLIYVHYQDMLLLHFRGHSVSCVLCLQWLCVSVSYKSNYWGHCHLQNTFSLVSRSIYICLFQ